MSDEPIRPWEKVTPNEVRDHIDELLRNAVNIFINPAYVDLPMGGPARFSYVNLNDNGSLTTVWQIGCLLHGLPLPCSECLHSAQMMHAAFGLLRKLPGC